MKNYGEHPNRAGVAKNRKTKRGFIINFGEKRLVDGVKYRLV